MNVSPTIVVLHEHAGVLELIEAAEIIRRLKVDLLVMSPAHNHAASDLRALQTGLSVVVLDDEPVWLDEIADAVAAAIPPRRECS